MARKVLSKGVVAVSLCVLAGTGVTACGSSPEDSPSQEELEQARIEGAQNARQQEQIKELEEQLDQAEEQGGTATTTVEVQSDAVAPPPSSSVIPGDARDCGDAFGAGSASCPFVTNVADDYYDSGQSPSFESYSPVTGQTYTVTCNGSGPTVCTAGNNATIYIP